MLTSKGPSLRRLPSRAHIRSQQANADVVAAASSSSQAARPLPPTRAHAQRVTHSEVDLLLCNSVCSCGLQGAGMHPSKPAQPLRFPTGLLSIHGRAFVQQEPSSGMSSTAVCVCSEKPFACRLAQSGPATIRPPPRTFCLSQPRQPSQVGPKLSPQMSWQPAMVMCQARIVSAAKLYSKGMLPPHLSVSPGATSLAGARHP